MAAAAGQNGAGENANALRLTSRRRGSLENKQRDNSWPGRGLILPPNEPERESEKSKSRRPRECK